MRQRDDVRRFPELTRFYARVEKAVQCPKCSEVEECLDRSGDNVKLADAPHDERIEKYLADVERKHDAEKLDLRLAFIESTLMAVVEKTRIAEK